MSFVLFGNYSVKTRTKLLWMNNNNYNLTRFIRFTRLVTGKNEYMYCSDGVFTDQIALIQENLQAKYYLSTIISLTALKNQWAEYRSIIPYSTSSLLIKFKLYCFNKEKILTIRPASLLCKFIFSRSERPRSPVSTNSRENLNPKPILSEHPPHSQSRTPTTCAIPLVCGERDWWL